MTEIPAVFQSSRTITSSTRPQVIGPRSWPVLDFVCKYTPAEIVCEHSKEFANLYSTIPVVGKHKHVLVDVKTCYLRAGQVPAMPWWHIDCVENVFAPGRPEEHWIYISGAGSQTEFALGDFAWPSTRRGLQNQAQGLPTYKLPEQMLAHYGRTSVHRATPATTSGTRTLIRVTETDVITPRTRIRKLKSLY